MNTVAKPMYEWNAIPWKQAEKAVFKLQKRIYQAAKRGEYKAVHKLQRLLMKSWWAALIAVRRVTQDNQGKKTAGVDGVKSLNPKQRLALAQKIQANPFLAKSAPVRRVWIPKPGNTLEKRGLGIPVMEIRARQALVKLGLEAEWEAYFEPNSYGFRPGRSAHDAIEAIFCSIKQKAKYVLDADIAKCFDKISHSALLSKLKTFAKLRRVIRGWLRAGIMEGETLFPSPEGVPQGGVASPLLANVALHGLEEAVVQKFSRRPPRAEDPHQSLVKPTLVRYADDLVVLDPSEKVIGEIKEFIAEWLSSMGLELKPSKTRLTHTLKRYQGNVGFDFLGFTVRQFPVGKAKTGKINGKPLGYKTIIKPSREKVKLHLARLGKMIDQRKGRSQGKLIKDLNPVIRGWSNYYRPACSKQTYGNLDHLLYFKLKSWAKRRHSNKSGQWIAEKYWHVSRGKWQFSTSRTDLYKHSDTPIQRHIKVRERKSPYDGDWVYWTTRMGRHPQVSNRVAGLLKRQKGRCAWCGLHFKNDDVVEQDHRTPLANGGFDSLNNLQLLHRHCHDSKTAADKKKADKVLMTTAD